MLIAFTPARDGLEKTLLSLNDVLGLSMLATVCSLLPLLPPRVLALLLTSVAISAPARSYSLVYSSPRSLRRKQDSSRQSFQLRNRVTLLQRCISGRVPSVPSSQLSKVLFTAFQTLQTETFCGYAHCSPSTSPWSRSSLPMRKASAMRTRNPSGCCNGWQVR